MKNVRENKQMFVTYYYMVFYLISNCIILSCNNNCCYVIKIIHMLKFYLRVLFAQPRVRSDSSLEITVIIIID